MRVVLLPLMKKKYTIFEEVVQCRPLDPTNISVEWWYLSSHVD